MSRLRCLRKSPRLGGSTACSRPETEPEGRTRGRDVNDGGSKASRGRVQSPKSKVQGGSSPATLDLGPWTGTIESCRGFRGYLSLLRRSPETRCRVEGRH